MAVNLDQLFVGHPNDTYLKTTLRHIAGYGISQAHDPNRDFYHIRTPMIVTTRAWLREDKYITCWCNPSNANWNIGRRESLQKTAAGMVRNTYRNRHRNSYFDSFPVAFNFQSGNIMPYLAKRGYDSEYISQVEGQTFTPDAIWELVPPPGLQNFYRFMSLLDEPSLGGNTANYHILIYHSRVFPQLWLEGWFTPDGFSFDDSGENGNRVNWSATMMVTRTVPPLSAYSLMEGLYGDWAKNTGTWTSETETGAEKYARRMAEAFDEGISPFTPGTGPGGAVKPGAIAKTAPWNNPYDQWNNPYDQWTNPYDLWANPYTGDIYEPPS